MINGIRRKDRSFTLGRNQTLHPETLFTTTTTFTQQPSTVSTITQIAPQSTILDTPPPTTTTALSPTSSSSSSLVVLPTSFSDTAKSSAHASNLKFIIIAIVLGILLILTAAYPAVWRPYKRRRDTRFRKPGLASGESQFDKAELLASSVSPNEFLSGSIYDVENNRFSKGSNPVAVTPIQRRGSTASLLSGVFKPRSSTGSQNGKLSSILAPIHTDIAKRSPPPLPARAKQQQMMNPDIQVTSPQGSKRNFDFDFDLDSPTQVSHAALENHPPRRKKLILLPPPIIPPRPANYSRPTSNQVPTYSLPENPLSQESTIVFSPVSPDNDSGERFSISNFPSPVIYSPEESQISPQTPKTPFSQKEIPAFVRPASQVALPEIVISEPRDAVLQMSHEDLAAFAGAFPNVPVSGAGGL